MKSDNKREMSDQEMAHMNAFMDQLMVPVMKWGAIGVLGLATVFAGSCSYNKRIEGQALSDCFKSAGADNVAGSQERVEVIEACGRSVHTGMHGW